MGTSTRVSLKPVQSQTIVITGATSGIGLATARMVARKGAKLVLAARNAEALDQLVQELKASGCQAVGVVADVGNEQQVKDIAQAAISHFGGFDTWVNNAGVSIFGPLQQVSIEDQRKLFDTNYWGVVYGSLAAVELLKQRGGALINIGSELSDAPAPLQGAYTASKHAVRGFTDSLRLELEHDAAPISVTLIKPAAIDTMFVEHAKNYMEVEPRLPPPLYAPDAVAEAILFAAAHPKRDIFVGSASKLFSTGARYTPRLSDKLLQRLLYRWQRTDQPAVHSEGSLHAPGRDLQERGGYPGMVRSHSLYTKASTHPKTTTAAAVVALGVAFALLKRRKFL